MTPRPDSQTDPAPPDSTRGGEDRDRGPRPPRPRSRAGAWLARRRPWVIAAIVVAAAIPRGVYFFQVQDGPTLYQHRRDQSDMSHFHAWAEQIAAGDLLSREVRPPRHLWHLGVARAYYEDHPAEQAAARAAGRDPVEALWDRWCGPGRFYQDPLYPYLVAATFKLAGPDVHWVFAWQMALGLAGVLLIHGTTRLAFGEIAGVVAAGLAILSGPLLFYEAVLLRASVISVAGLAIAYLTMRAVRGGRWPWWAAAGLAAGAGVLLKAHLKLCPLAVAAALPILYGRKWARLAAAGGAFAAGVAVALAPLVARNLAVGAPPLETACGGALAFIGGNDATYVGPGFAMDPETGANIMARTDGRLLPAVAATLRTHPDAGSYLGLLARKAGRTFRRYEQPNNTCFDYFRLYCPVLSWLPVGFAVIGSAGAVGMCVGLRRLRRAWPLYLVAGANLVLPILFIPVSRYRVPAMAAMTPFAAFLIVHAAERLRRRRWACALLPAAAAVALGIWIARPLPEHHPRIRAADYATGFQAYYQPKVSAAVGDGDWPGVAALLDEALAAAPTAIDEMAAGRAAHTRNDAWLARFFGELYDARAVCSRRLERPGAAEAFQRKSDTLWAAYNAYEDAAAAAGPGRR
jgi:4-amino-4-deoxy-L-arabinose transferase-like glycosyltransferase